METTELFRLGEWVQHEIVERNIPGHYDSLIAVLNQNVKRANNQAFNSFEAQKQKLYEELALIDISGLTLSQIHILKTVGLYPVIDAPGIAQLDEIFINTLDIAHVLQRVGEMKNSLAQGLGQINQINAALAPLIDEDEVHLPVDKVLTRVIFEHDAGITNISELKGWSSKWFDIGRGFAVANGHTPEDVEVIGAARGSIIIELALLATSAYPIAKAINIILDSMVKYKEFQLKSIEVRNMKAETPDLSSDFEQDAVRWEERADALKQEIIGSVVEEVKQYFDNYQDDNKAELRSAVKSLVEFLSKGGDVDCVITEEDDDDEPLNAKLAIIKEEFTRIRQIKTNELLEHQPLDFTDED